MSVISVSINIEEKFSMVDTLRSSIPLIVSRELLSINKLLKFVTSVKSNFSIPLIVVKLDKPAKRSLGVYPGAKIPLSFNPVMVPVIVIISISVSPFHGKVTEELKVGGALHIELKCSL